MLHKHHIIPKHMGGSDDPSNLIECTIEQHAEFHKKLYEQHGHWQDKLAWMGLAKLMTKAEIVKEQLSIAGKKGAATANSAERRRFRKKTKPASEWSGSPKNSILFKSGSSNPSSKYYTITLPDKSEITVKSLRFWCNSNNINYASFHKITVHEGKAYRDYRCVRLSNASVYYASRCAKTYKITYPDFAEETITNLKLWCEKNNFKYTSFRKATVTCGRKFKDFSCELVKTP